MHAVDRHACDVRVVRLLRERVAGNSASQLHRKLCEQHSEDWPARTLQYLTACQPFASSSLTTASTFTRPPERPALPSPKWLMTVYVRDVLGRLDDVKAKLTYVYGTVLKMDSTKKGNPFDRRYDSAANCCLSSYCLLL